MKKELIILAFAACYCSVTVDAQKTTQNPCDSMQMFYDQALVVLDSVTGNQIQLQKQLEASRADISKSRSEARQLLKDNTDIKADLKEARKLIGEQLKRIEELEAEVRRLSTPGKSTKQKGT